MEYICIQLTISNIDIIIKVEIAIFDIDFESDCMPREKFVTLTEQMFYILICLQNECCGIDIMEMVNSMTEGRVKVGPGTLYNLLEQFVEEAVITLTKVEGKKRSYIITQKGKDLLEKEYNRLLSLTHDYTKYVGKEQ